MNEYFLLALALVALYVGFKIGIWYGYRRGRNAGYSEGYVTSRKHMQQDVGMMSPRKKIPATTAAGKV